MRGLPFKRFVSANFRTLKLAEISVVIGGGLRESLVFSTRMFSMLYEKNGMRETGRGQPVVEDVGEEGAELLVKGEAGVGGEEGAGQLLETLETSTQMLSKSQRFGQDVVAFRPRRSH